MSLQSILQAEDTVTIEDNIKNKVNFALNNLTETNMEKHQHDIRSYAENNDNFLNWFAKYLVLRRATHESEGNVQLYVALVEKLSKPRLFSLIIKESLVLLHKLLLSEVPLSASDRNMLKNIGYWIGIFTLNRNKPISAKYLNLKALIVSSYPNKCDVIIPIVYHILRSTKDSKIFSPNTNRWVRRILSLLEELKGIL